MLICAKKFKVYNLLPQALKFKCPKTHNPALQTVFSMPLVDHATYIHIVMSEHTVAFAVSNPHLPYLIYYQGLSVDPP